MYKVNIPEAGEWTISTCSNITDFDTKLIVGTAECASDLGEDTNSCTDNKAELTLTFTTVQDVYVTVVSENDELGNFELSVSKMISSIKDLNASKIKVYPNPTSALLNIDLEETAKADYQVYNINGQLVQDGSLENSNQIDVKELSNGFYTIAITQEDKTYQAKFLKRK